MKLTNKLNYLAFFVFVLICFIICGNTGIIAFANTLNVGNITNMDVEVRKVEMFDYFVDCMNQIYATNVKRGNIRALEDFAGNKYTLVECIPQGYLIYNNSSGNVIEYSATSSSPYLKKTGTILYGGPSFFVYKNNNVYNHIITEQQYSEEQVQILTTSSNTLYQESCNNPNNDVLSYINKGEVSNVINVDQTGKLVTNASTRASFSYVSNYDFSLI